MQCPSLPLRLGLTACPTPTILPPNLKPNLKHGQASHFELPCLINSLIMKTSPSFHL
ncbi:hypothetical protein BDP27DRAFT_1337055 [Rhodocollybia butyracea]|uniref:Uncharacterized protein n=1 Tax=Rhodocollybia butyracea TaxID=206335 RepID=A0A9P5PF29_9AGAR|nr:hypothetical protein BDP27DRAFT_1337055 [Rhodocollybia butyracea]